MAKLTYLEIVQDILNDMDSDIVNSINDTVESLQVAQIVKTTFFEMMGNRNWPHLKRTVQLDSSGTTSRPTHLKLPVLTKELISFNYDKRKEEEPNRSRYDSVQWIEPETFLRKYNKRNETEDNIIKVIDHGGVELLIRNDVQPTHYTSFDDEYIVCDAYNSGLESTLQTARTQCLVYVEPSWEMSDSFVPDLPSEAFPALLEEAKSTAFVVLKQTANDKAEQKSQRQQRWLSRKAWRVSGGVRYPDYGRRRNMTSVYRSPFIDKEASLSVN